MGILFEKVYLTEKRYIFIECNAWKTRLMTVLPMMSNSTTVDDQLRKKKLRLYLYSYLFTFYTSTSYFLFKIIGNAFITNSFSSSAWCCMIIIITMTVRKKSQLKFSLSVACNVMGDFRPD